MLQGVMPVISKSRNIGTIASEEAQTCVGTVRSRERKSIKDELLPKGKPMGDYVPVYVAIGMIGLSVTFGLMTAKQELLYAPDVHVKKSRRETLPEVVEPENVVHESEGFVKKSFFRKIAHIQENKEPVIPNPILGDPLARLSRVESLKTVGVDPK
uniref:Uncharacterized protein n=2 Tax=Chenopodium quinoa TaxID=63459 RepID=A0A803MXP1_CHEQI